MKPESVNRKAKDYGAREEARSDIFDYIAMFYNSKRPHGSGDKMPPTEYENQYYQQLKRVWIIRGDSIGCVNTTAGAGVASNIITMRVEVHFSWE